MLYTVFVQFVTVSFVDVCFLGQEVLVIKVKSKNKSKNK